MTSTSGKGGPSANSLKLGNPMKTYRSSPKWALFLLAFLASAMDARTAKAQYGTILSGTGAVNRSFGGVAVATPLSPAGAMYWNPATLSGFDRSEFEADAELLFPHSSAASQVSAGALGPGIPPVGLAGRTDSDIGVFPLPTIGLVYVPHNSDFTFGLGVFAAAGFGVDYAGSNINPLLTAPPPRGLGFGSVYSEFEDLQINPAVAYRLTERITVSAGPILNLARLEVKPGLFAPPDNASGNGFATYPDATHGQTTWGGGFIAGVYYKADTWGAGASVKSPQWFDTFRFNSTDQVGGPRDLALHADLPMIVSFGAAYTGLDRWVFGADFHYIDYRDAEFLGDQGFDANGAVHGLGWRSVFAVALGAQYQLTEALSLRLGYSWNENPIPNSQSFVSTPAPVIIENMISAGASWKVTEDFTLSFAYVHAFENSIEGPLVTPAGPVPGTAVKNSAYGDIFVLSGSVKFGGPRSGVIAEKCQSDAASQ
jgi:long-chain fatty acid transport protein